MTTKAESTASKKTAESAKKGYEAFAEMFSAPTFDAAAIFEFQRKNMDASVEAGKILFDGIKAAAQKQIDLSKDALAEITEASTDVFTNKTPETGFAKTVEFTQGIMRKNLANMREVSDVMISANQKAVSILQDRYEAGSKEMKAASK